MRSLIRAEKDELGLVPLFAKSGTSRFSSSIGPVTGDRTGQLFVAASSVTRDEQWVDLIQYLEMIVIYSTAPPGPYRGFIASRYDLREKPVAGATPE